MMVKPAGKPKLILMADDSALTRTVIKKQLSVIYPDAAVTEARNGEEAITAIKNSRDVGNEFDLLLLDFMMPVKNGLEVLAFVRETDKTVPAFILTANVQDATRKKAFEIGCTGFLKKTLSADDLRAGLEPRGDI